MKKCKCCDSKIMKIIAICLALTAVMIVFVKFWDEIMNTLLQIKDKAKALCKKECAVVEEAVKEDFAD